MDRRHAVGNRSSTPGRRRKLLYHGTVDLATPTDDTEATLGVTERASWFNTYETDSGIGGQKAGFIYSRLQGSGDRASTDTPVTGGDQIVDGLHGNPILGSTGHSASSSTIFENTEVWDTSEITPGTSGYVLAEVTDGTTTRYLYASPKLDFTDTLIFADGFESGTTDAWED